MKKPQQPLVGTRNSSIELLKIFAILLVVISHVLQTLHEPNEYFANNDYLLDLSMATTNAQQLILALLRYSGALGNTIFFACSAWFLLDSEKANKKKLLRMLLDVWVISVLILIVVLILQGGSIGIKLMLKQLLPVTFDTNWYVTCYLVFYPVHPFLNWLIKKMDQRTLLKTTLVLLLLYVFANFMLANRFHFSSLILWVTLYFAIAYMKFYLPDLSSDPRRNRLLLAVGVLGNIALVLLTNLLGLRFEAFSDKLLHWNTNCNPFLILTAISLLNLTRNTHFHSKAVNYISGLSLLIYVIHENQLLRIFYRPLLWELVYTRFGYKFVLLWAFVLVVAVFSFGLIAAIVYKSTLQKAVAALCNRLYPMAQKLYRKLEQRILRLQ